MTQTIVFDTSAHRSRVLDGWLASRPGGADRAGVVALGENSVTTNLTVSELASALGVANTSAAGVNVTPQIALRVAAVYGCVSLIAGAIATLPVGIYERSDGDRKKAEHDYWWMFNEQASTGWTSASAWEYVISSKLLYGDGYAELIRPSRGSTRIIGWAPLHPTRVTPFQEDGVVYYRLADGNGSTRVLDASDVLHFPSLGFDGLTSPSPITYAARETIGTAIAAEAYQSKFFANGASFDYALHTPHSLKADQLEALKTSLVNRASGGRAPLVLTGDLKPVQLSVNSKDAEILGTRSFGVEEICRVFGVPPHMIGHTDKTTSWGSGIEQQSMGFVRYTLMRILVPVAQEVNRKLWPSRAKYFVEHVTSALERGDLKGRNDAYRVALGRAGEPGWMTVNEVRRIENMPPVQGGDEIATAAAPQNGPTNEQAGQATGG